MPPKASSQPASSTTGEASGDPGKVTKQHISTCDGAVRQVRNGKALSKALKQLQDAKLPRTLEARATACCYLVHSEEAEARDGDQQKKLGALTEAAAAVQPVASECLLASYLACFVKMQLATAPEGRLEAARVFSDECESRAGEEAKGEPPERLLLALERDFLFPTTKNDPFVDPPVLVWHLTTAIKACARVSGAGGGWVPCADTTLCRYPCPRLCPERRKLLWLNEMTKVHEARTSSDTADKTVRWWLHPPAHPLPAHPFSTRAGPCEVVQGAGVQVKAQRYQGRAEDGACERGTAGSHPESCAGQRRRQGQ
jgi:hypothetical protein